MLQILYENLVSPDATSIISLHQSAHCFRKGIEKPDGVYEEFI